ncbi:MAG: hypothetical protein SX243_14550, partial [Acidobacteriota bacterium]|nr:hypothetical protein [Acidobacteriota bacterium]
NLRSRTPRKLIPDRLPRPAPAGSRRGDRLHLLWRTTAEVAKETLDGLADDFLDALRALIRHCESPEAGGFSAADFPLAQVEEDDLESAFAEFDFEDFDE